MDGTGRDWHRLGAMVFGGVNDERIQFNEDTLWTGHPHDYVRAGAGDRQKSASCWPMEKQGGVGPPAPNFFSDPVRQKVINLSATVTFTSLILRRHNIDGTGI